MGAHGWWYEVDELDPEKALKRAQLSAFYARKYGKPYAKGEPRARSITELRKLCAEEGTCSVIDVTALGARRGPGIAAALTEPQLRALVGEARPTREELLDARGDIQASLDRGEAVWTHLWDLEREDRIAIAFVGLSYD